VAIRRRFADEYFEDSYANFARINRGFTAFALLAVAIATIGLFAIALSVANRRRVEIGVRKILGGNARQMTIMLLAAFSKPVIVANLVAWPLAYIAARSYLALFISPIELTFAPFAAVFPSPCSWRCPQCCANPCTRRESSGPRCCGKSDQGGSRQFRPGPRSQSRRRSTLRRWPSKSTSRSKRGSP
jgi:hypothetical protein